MTPAIKLLQQRKIDHQVHRYTHDRNAASYGLEAAEKMGVDEARVFKTLVVSLDNKSTATAIVPVARQLNLKAVAAALGAKRAQMGDRAVVERITGYVLGGVSPLGQKKRSPTVLDESARRHTTIFVSAGQRGMEIELAPEALLDVVDGQFSAIATL